MGRSALGPPHAAVAFAALLAVAGACGGGSDAPPSGGDHSSPTVLFTGDARDLLPHDPGRSATFESTATAGGTVAQSRSTARVIASSPDGTFVTEQVLDDGRRARLEARDLGDEIRIERAIVDPGGANEEIVALDPPAILVQTPVIAGERLRTTFVRMLDVAVRLEGTVVKRRLAFSGKAERTPLELATIRVPAGEFANAVRYAVVARGSAELDLPGVALGLTVEATGEEFLVPGVGLVREAVDVVVRSAGEESTVNIVTERLGDP